MQHAVLAESLGGSATPTTGGATSKTTAAADYSHLLIKPDAHVESYTAHAPTLNPHGVPGAATVFVNHANTRAIGNTVFVLPTPKAATTSLNGAKQALGTVVDGATPQPVPVGANGTAAAGHSPDGSKAVTVVMFTEGRTFVTLKFDAASPRRSRGDSRPRSAELAEACERLNALTARNQVVAIRGLARARSKVRELECQVRELDRLIAALDRCFAARWSAEH